MSEKTEAIDMEVVSSDAAEAEASIADSKDVSRDIPGEGESKKSRNIMLFLLIVVVILVAGLVANGQLQALYSQFTGKASSLSDRPVVSPSLQGSASSEQLQELIIKIDSLQSELNRMIEAGNRPAQAQTGEPAADLRAGIANLGSEMTQLAEAQKDLRSSLHKQQQANLQVRLRWITDPASHLPQIKLAWEEISLLSDLDDAQLAKAEEMHALARNTIQQLRQLKSSMQEQADMLVAPVHKDILPKPEQPWLAWVIGQFHLRPAPSEEDRLLRGLRHELEVMINRLTTEDWPAANVWQHLRAQLVLQARNRQAIDDTEPLELDLPESFEAIKSDINTLRQTARQWLGQS